MIISQQLVEKLEIRKIFKKHKGTKIQRNGRAKDTNLDQQQHFLFRGDPLKCAFHETFDVPSAHWKWCFLRLEPAYCHYHCNQQIWQQLLFCFSTKLQRLVCVFNYSVLRVNQDIPERSDHILVCSDACAEACTFDLSC